MIYFATTEYFLIPKSEFVITFSSLFFTALGYYTKGVLFSLLGELIYKPTAHYILKKGKKWEQTRPKLHRHIIHFIENHQGHRPSQCQHCKN